MKQGPNPKVFIMMSLASLVLGGGLVYMQFNNLTNSKEEFTQEKAKERDASEVKAELETSTADLNGAKLKLDHLEKSVSAETYVPTMLAELEHMGKANGLKVTGVRPSVTVAPPAPRNGGDKEAAPKRKPYKELDIQVKASGDYYSVLRFMEALTQFPKIVAARSVSLTPHMSQKSGELVGSLEIEIMLRAYLFPDAKQPAKDQPKEVRNDGVISNG